MVAQLQPSRGIYRKTCNYLMLNLTHLLVRFARDGKDLGRAVFDNKFFELRRWTGVLFKFAGREAFGRNRDVKVEMPKPVIDIGSWRALRDAPENDGRGAPKGAAASKPGGKVLAMFASVQRAVVSLWERKFAPNCPTMHPSLGGRLPEYAL